VPVETSRGRRVYIDWARGLAVLLMIEAHTADAWTRAADRHSAAFGRALVLGGFAAPLFLYLAGVGVALSAARLVRTGGTRGAVVRAICSRGLEIFILAFLFRLQAFIVTPGSYPITIFRVDILNVMGPAIVAAGLVWPVGASSRALVLWYATMATVIALLTPIVRTAAIVDVLPLWLQWYVKPAGDLTAFTLFPWVGFVFAGAACGVILATTDNSRTERRAQFAFAAAGLVFVALGQFLSRRPSIYDQSQFWTSSPTWFAMRVGILMTAVAVLHAISEIASLYATRKGAVPLFREAGEKKGDGPFSTASRSLERFGRSSLFVYWIHVELVYGYATWPLHHRLPLWGTLIAFAAFSMLMYRAVIFRDRVVDNWRTRSRSRHAPETATA
jgi:uncharacterized membrane protein